MNSQCLMGVVPKVRICIYFEITIQTLKCQDMCGHIYIYRERFFIFAFLTLPKYTWYHTSNRTKKLMETHARTTRWNFFEKLGSLFAPTVGLDIPQNNQKQLNTCGKYTDLSNHPPLTAFLKSLCDHCCTIHVWPTPPLGQECWNVGTQNLLTSNPAHPRSLIKHFVDGLTTFACAFLYCLFVCGQNQAHATFQPLLT